MALTTDHVDPPIDLIGEDPSSPIEGGTFLLLLPEAKTRGSLLARAWRRLRMDFSDPDYRTVSRGIDVRIDGGTITIAEGGGGSEYTGPIAGNFTLQCRLRPGQKLRNVGFLDDPHLGPHAALVLHPVRPDEAPPGDVLLSACESIPVLMDRIRRASDFLGLEFGADRVQQGASSPLAKAPPRKSRRLKISRSDRLLSFRTTLGMEVGYGKPRTGNGVKSALSYVGLLAIVFTVWAALALVEKRIGKLPAFIALAALVAWGIQQSIIDDCTSFVELRFDDEDVELVRTLKGDVDREWRRQLRDLLGVYVIMVDPKGWGVMLTTGDDVEFFGGNARLSRGQAEWIRATLLERLAASATFDSRGGL